MFKNVAGQKIIFIAYDTTTGLLKTGDAANLTAYQSLDSASPPTVLGDTSAAEISATLANGAYSFDLAQGETNGDMILYTCNSVTANVQLDPVLVFTTAAGSNVSVLAESYRANGAAGTLAQLLYEILAHMGEAAIVGTTKTLNKIDHATAAETFTLNDATAPTSITRTT